MSRSQPLSPSPPARPRTRHHGKPHGEEGDRARVPGHGYGEQSTRQGGHEPAHPSGRPPRHPRRPFRPRGEDGTRERGKISGQVIELAPGPRGISTAGSLPELITV